MFYQLVTFLKIKHKFQIKIFQKTFDQIFLDKSSVLFTSYLHQRVNMLCTGSLAILPNLLTPGLSKQRTYFLLGY